MRSWGWLFFLILCIAGLVTAQKEDAKKLLESLAQRYDQAKALALEGTITTLTKSPSTETKMTVVVNLVFQKPNKFRVVIKDPKGQIHQLLASDGTFMFREFPALKQVLKRPAPKAGIPIAGGNLLAGSLKEQLIKVKETQIVGEEKLGQRKAKVIKVVAEDGTTVLFWISENILWQVKATIEGEQLVRGTGSKEQPNPFAEAMKQTTITQTITFNKVTFNPKLAPNVFAYKPPAGFKVVEKLEMPTMQPGQIIKPNP